MMAVLTDVHKSEIRKGFQSENDTADWVKADLNDAIDAINTHWDNNLASLSTAIDAATTFNFSNEMKKKIGRWWMAKRFKLGG